MCVNNQMLKVILPLLLLFIYSCGSDQATTQENPECRCESYQTCENNECVLKSGHCNTKDDCNSEMICTDHLCEAVAYQNPCANNPCTEANQTVCSDIDHNEVAECSCDDGYSLNDQQICAKPPLTCTKIRMMGANITSGQAQAYEIEGIRIFQGVKPDIVMIQEFNYESGTRRNLVDTAFGSQFYYHVGKGDIPNGIISKWPILETGKWDDNAIDNRDLDWAIVDIPGDRDLFVISVHLRAGADVDQQRGAQVITKKIVAIKAAKPNRYYFVVGGDFNGDASIDDKAFGSYYGDPVFNIEEPFPVGEDGKPNTNFNRKKPYDFILAGIDLQPFHEPLVITNPNDDTDFLQYDDGLIFDTRDFDQYMLDAYFYPALEKDSSAPSMQHMAIVKQFNICQ